MKFRLSLVERWTGIFLCELILSTNETRAEQGGTALETGSVAGYFVRTSLLPVGCFGQRWMLSRQHGACEGNRPESLSPHLISPDLRKCF